ncbi:MAG: N-acetylmuramoyl-L-alanine amidase [Bacteroidales bacterium]|nr:N-acetylmuramoyl-L-alanine amidase [Bacteroidales bacterium]MCF8398266.1 N-acetylmuramoyl-L-alanine amidase [Bacteroidales bacterium]
MKIMIVVKRVFAFFGIVALVFLPLHDAFADGEGRIRKVVIDAGHGGRDPGALGKNSREKDIALSIALKTGGYIEKYLPDVEVIYTRKSDRFVELHKRAQIANEAQADLFISIHCNANNSSQPYGTETYVMGLHKSQANLEVAQKENAAILKEEDYQAEYEGFDPESPEAYIIFSLFQNAFLDQSLEFASLVQNQFKERVGLRDRGVMQAGFLVLYRITMPGVLVETGYLTNSKDEKYLMSEKGQVYIASAIYRAFKAYKKEMEKDLPDLIIPENTQLAESGKDLKDRNEKSSAKQEIEDDRDADQQVLFKVQFATSAELIKDYATKFIGLEQLGYYDHNGLIKYTSGSFSSFQEANKYKNKVRRKGYKDAFVIAMQKDRRISLAEARKMHP